VIALLLVVLSVGVTLGVFYPFGAVILASYGFSPGEIGLITSAGAVGFTIAVPAWGHLADVRFGRARTLRMCAIGAALVIGILLLPVPTALVVLAFVVFPIFQSTWQPLADALTVNAVRPRDYARVRTLTSVGFAVAAIVAGVVYDQTSYRTAFLLFAGGALVLAVAATFVRDTARADLAHHRADGREATAGGRRRLVGISLGSSGVALRVAPRLGSVLLAAALVHVGMISGFTFLPLRIESLGGGASEVALAAGLSAAAEIPAMLVMGALAARVGLRTVFVASALLYAACMASWAVIDVPLLIVATRILTGLAFSGVLVGIVLTIATLLPSDLQATGQGLFQTTAFGLAAIVANVAGGALYEWGGAAALFGVCAILAVGAALVGWHAFPARGTTPGMQGAVGADAPGGSEPAG
jgi:PPP family 3-phenylpropionic acid transporter